MAYVTPAQKAYRNRYKKKTKTSSKKSTTEKLEDSVKNYKTRLNAVGSEDTTDDRNVVEKFFNLGQNQGLIRDLLELLDRPRNALFTGIDYALQGDNAGKGLLEGIKGEAQTSGKDLLVNHAGMSDTEGQLDWSDILGFGLDLVGDPLDYLTLPVGAVSKVGKVAKAIDTGTDIAQGISKASKIAGVVDTASDVAKGISKASKVANAVDTASDIAKAVDTASDVVKPTYRGIKGALSNAMNKITPDLVWAPANQAAMNWLGKGVKGTGKLADIGIEKVLSKSDDALKTYQDMKKSVSKLLDSSKSLGGFVGKAREADNLGDLTRMYGQKVANNISDQARNIAKNYKNIDILKDLATEDDAYNAILQNLTHAVEKSKDWAYTGKELIDDLVQNKNVYVYNKEVADNIVKNLKEYGIKANVVDGNKVKLLDNKNKLLSIQDSLNNMNFGQKISANAKKTQQTALDLFGSNDELSNLFNYAKTAPESIAGLTDVKMGTQTGKRITEGYVTHNLNKDVYRSTSGSVGSRKYQIPIAEINEQKRLSSLEKISDLEGKGQKAAEGIFKTDDAGHLISKSGKKYVINDAGQLTDLKGNIVDINEANLARKDNTFNTIVENKEKNIKRFKEELASHEELSKARGAGGDLDITKVDRSKLNAKDARIYDRVEASNTLINDIKEIKKTNFDDIKVPNADEVINETRNAYNDYSKSVTAYQNILKKKNATEDVISAAKQEMLNKRKLMTAKLTEVQAMSNKSNTAIFKNANKAFKEGKKVGSSIVKNEAKLAKQDALVKKVFDSLADTSTGLKGKLKYEQDSLSQLLKNEGTIKNSIYNKKLNTIKQVAEDYAILNSPEAKEFFTENFNENLIEFANRNAKVGAAANKLNTAVLTGTLNNPDYIKLADEVFDKTGKKVIPYGFEKISGTYVQKKFEKIINMLPESSQKKATELLNSLKGKTLLMDKDLITTLDLGVNATKELNPFMKFLNGVNNTFKKFSTLTAGFQVRNIIGNGTNMVLSGVPASELAQYYEKASKIWNNADDLIQKAVKGNLTEVEAKDFDILTDFYKAGFADAFTKGQGLEAIKNSEKKGLISLASKKSSELNEKVDSYNRMALLAYAKDNPDYITRLGKNSAIDAVKYVLFDPSNMSDLEKNGIKKIIPFYTFTKQNLMFQATNLMKNTGKYTKLYRFIENAYNDLPENSYYDYQKEGMQIPLPFTGIDGNQLFLKANLPVSDLEEYISHPVQRILASTSPIIKTPTELVTGKSLYTGEDTNYKVLSNTLNKLGIYDKGVENSAQAAETILNGLGLQNITTNLIKKVQAIIDKSNGEKSGNALWAEIFRSVLQNTNQENVKTSGLYDELEAYQAEIKRLKRQGIDVPTIREMTAKNKIKLNNAKRKRASLR